MDSFQELSMNSDAMLTSQTAATQSDPPMLLQNICDPVSTTKEVEIFYDFSNAISDRLAEENATPAFTVSHANSCKHICKLPPLDQTIQFINNDTLSRREGSVVLREKYVNKFNTRSRKPLDGAKQPQKMILEHTPIHMSLYPDSSGGQLDGTPSLNVGPLTPLFADSPTFPVPLGVSHKSDWSRKTNYLTATDRSDDIAESDKVIQALKCRNKRFLRDGLIEFDHESTCKKARCSINSNNSRVTNRIEHCGTNFTVKEATTVEVDNFAYSEAVSQIPKTIKGSDKLRESKIGPFDVPGFFTPKSLKPSCHFIRESPVEAENDDLSTPSGSNSPTSIRYLDSPSCRSNDYSFRVLALFRGQNFWFMPATIESWRQTDDQGALFRVRFDDNDQKDELPSTKLRKLEIAPGSFCKLSKDHTLLKIKNLWNTNRKTIETDIHGNTSVVAEKIRSNESTSIIEVKISNLYWTLKQAQKLPSFEGKYFENLPIRLWQKSDLIFSNMAFSISISKNSKHWKETRHKIEKACFSNGATIISDSLLEILEEADLRKGEITLSEKYAKYKFAAVLSDNYSRNVKYLQAIALGIPCISLRFIFDCIEKSKFLEWHHYLLPAGVCPQLSLNGENGSLSTESVLKSQHFDYFEASSLFFQLNRRRRLIHSIERVVILHAAESHDRLLAFSGLILCAGSTNTEIISIKRWPKNFRVGNAKVIIMDKSCKEFLNSKLSTHGNLKDLKCYTKDEVISLLIFGKWPSALND